jgi:hypothetical protein
VDERVWARGVAGSERFWSAQNVTDLSSAQLRMSAWACRLNRRGIRTSPSMPDFCLPAESAPAASDAAVNPALFYIGISLAALGGLLLMAALYVQGGSSRHTPPDADGRNLNFSRTASAADSKGRNTPNGRAHPLAAVAADIDKPNKGSAKVTASQNAALIFISEINKLFDFPGREFERLRRKGC